MDRVGKVAYQLVLPPKMLGVHYVFHISMLRKYICDPSHVVECDDIEVSENVTYKERPMRILDHNFKKLQNKDIALVKIQ